MKKIIAVILCVALLLTCFVGCGKTDKDLVKVRVNEVTHSIFYAPQYLAMEMGFFKDEGLDIELTNGGGSNVSMTAVISGQADIGLMGPETAIYVYNEGRKDYPIVFGQLTKRDGSFLISRKDEPNFDIKSLEGKEIIAGRRGGLPAMTLEYLLNQNGLYDGKNITLNFDVAFNMMAGAFEGGQGDYTTLFEPTSSSFVNAKKGYNVLSVGQGAGEVPFTCFIATSSYINDNPEIIKSYLRAIYRAIEFMKESDLSTVAKALAPQFNGTSESDIENAVKSYLAIDAWMTNLAMTEDSFIRLQDIMANAGELSGRCEYTKLIENKYANEVYEEYFNK